MQLLRRIAVPTKDLKSIRIVVRSEPLIQIAAYLLPVRCSIVVNVIDTQKIGNCFIAAYTFITIVFEDFIPDLRIVSFLECVVGSTVRIVIPFSVIVVMCAVRF